MAIRFETADPSSVFSEIRELRLRCFPEMAGTEAESETFFRWKFVDWRSHIFLARDDDSGSVVGFYAANRLRYQSRDRPVTVGLVVDVMTDPKVRKQGIFTRLGRYALDGMKAAGCDFTTGYPIRPEVLPGHLKVGWKVQQRLPMYMFAVRPSRVMPKVPTFVARPAELLGSVAARVFTRTASVSADQDHEALSFVTTEELVSLADYETFLGRWRKGRNLALAEGSEFYRWRYSAPARTFHHLVGRIAGQLSLVMSVRNVPLRGVATAAVADVQMLEEARSLMPAAWRAVWRRAWRDRQSVIATMASAAVARTSRFFSLPLVPSPFVFQLITCDLASAAPNVEADETAKLMWADTDDI